VGTPGADHSAPLSAPRSRWVLRSVNAALVVGALLIVAIPFEFLFRHRYAHLLYTPRAEVRAVQQYLTLDPVIGFRWQSNVSQDRGVRFVLNDIKPAPLSTDAFGIMNLPAAIADQTAGPPVDVVGLGDSFMEMANPGFDEKFRAAGLSYYSLAIHRQCPPQYNAILDRRGRGMKPGVILYGLFENDFNEISDYRSWQRSGLDWFAYHSGTWCGPPIGATRIERAMRTRARGWYAFTRILNARLRGERMTLTGPTRSEIEDAAACVTDAASQARELDAQFILLLIPSKQTATAGETLEARAYDAMLEMFPEIQAIDLRSIFQAHPQPESLYYDKDSHWNERGVALAADCVLKRLESPAP